MAEMRRPHLDADSIAEAVEDFVTAGQTARTAAHVAHAVNTGVVTPANVAYTQADQTALANAVNSLTAQLNAALDALHTAGLMA